MDGSDQRARQISEIIRALSRIQYGSVEITIHESKIVQVETREKVRFQKEKEAP